jgi:hypothetical protein
MSFKIPEILLIISCSYLSLQGYKVVKDINKTEIKISNKP